MPRRTKKTTMKRITGEVDLVPTSIPAIAFQFPVSGTVSDSASVPVTIPIPTSSLIRTRSARIDISGSGIVSLKFLNGSGNLLKQTRPIIVTQDIRTVVLKSGRFIDYASTTLNPTVLEFTATTGSTCNFSGVVTGSYILL